MEKKAQTRQKYPSDLTDAQGAIVAPLLPPAKQSARGGHPRTVDMREVLTTIFYLHRSGGPGAMRPQDVLPTSTVYDSLAPWRDDGTWAPLVQALRARTRVAAGREPPPRAACIERPTVKPTARGGPERGDEGGKNIKGRTRPLWGATLGLLRAVLLTRAGLAAGVAAPLLLRHVPPQDLPRLVTIFADQQEHHQALDAWMATPRTGWRSEVQARPEGLQGFTPLETRGVMERTHAWHGRYRRHRKDDERSGEARTAMLQVRNIHRMLTRLAPCDRPVFHYRRDAA